MLAYVLVQLFTGKAKSLSPVSIVLTVLFVLKLWMD
jgi:xanthine/uracil/vitamin C permease (AzgA family)